MQPQFPSLRLRTPSQLVLVEQIQLDRRAQREAIAVWPRLSLLKEEDLEPTQAIMGEMVALAAELMPIIKAQAEHLEQQQLGKVIVAESNHLLQLIAQAAAVAREPLVAMQLTAETEALDQIHTALGQRRRLRA
jgi:hypothetical protein